jgi:hypothetical protein
MQTQEQSAAASVPRWGARVRLTDPKCPKHVPDRGWKMGACDHCRRGDRENPLPVRKTLSRTLICPGCYAVKHRPTQSA